MEANLTGSEEYLSCEPEKRWLKWIPSQSGAQSESSTTWSTAVDPSELETSKCTNLKPTHFWNEFLFFFSQYQTEM